MKVAAILVVVSLYFTASSAVGVFKWQGLSLSGMQRYRFMQNSLRHRRQVSQQCIDALQQTNSGQFQDCYHVYGVFEGKFETPTNDNVTYFCDHACGALINKVLDTIDTACGNPDIPNPGRPTEEKQFFNDACHKDLTGKLTCLMDVLNLINTPPSSAKTCFPDFESSGQCNSNCIELLNNFKNSWGCCSELIPLSAMASATGPFGLLLLLSFLFAAALSDHIRGGSLRWQPLNNPGEVRFTYELTVRREGENTRCNQFNVGSFQVDGTGDIVASGEGLVGNTVLARSDYVCTGFSLEEGVVQGVGSFAYTFPSSSSAYSVRLQECCLPAYAGDAEFLLTTVVDLSPRGDTGAVNTPPISSTPSLLYLAEGCDSQLRLLVTDDDGDDVRCRPSLAEECGASGCFPFPSWVVLDSPTCTLTFNAPVRGITFLSLTLEDFPQGQNTPIASVPIGLTINVTSSNQSCSAKPTFDASVTPADGSCDTITTGNQFKGYFLVTPPAGESIVSFHLSGVAGAAVVRTDQPGGQVLFEVRWTPSALQRGTHVLSYLAIDSARRSSDVRFLTLFTGATRVALETGSNLPNTLVLPENREFNISFDQMVQTTSVRRLLLLVRLTPSRTVLESIDVSRSAQVSTSGSTLTVTIASALEEGQSYALVLEDGVVVPQRACPQLPGGTALVLPADFNWTFTAGYPPCHRNCSAACAPEQWQRDLCSFYAQLRQWRATGGAYGLSLPPLDPAQEGSPDQQWQEARQLWAGLVDAWTTEAQSRGFSPSGGGGSDSTPAPGSALNGEWASALGPWFDGQAFWTSTVGVSLGEGSAPVGPIRPDQWGEVLGSWSRGSQAYDVRYGSQLNTSAT